MAVQFQRSRTKTSLQPYKRASPKGIMALSWRYVYFASIGLRFVFALSNSYIHPDEHFQGLEVLSGRLFGVSVNEPWEFGGKFPARSIVPLLIVYYGPLKLAHWLGLLPLQVWYVVRLVFMSVSWVVTDWCLYHMLPTKQERIKAIFFVLTSYISLVHQSHTFSNSIETVLVVLTVYYINELRFWNLFPEKNATTGEILRAALAIGALFAFGTFNRVTFPAFFVFPALFFIQSSCNWPYVSLAAATTFTFTSVCCVVADTMWFKQKAFCDIWLDPFNWRQYIVTPYNSLMYNTSKQNLAQHGLHPFYTHVLVNLPQIFGPGLILLFPRFRNSYWKTTPFLAALSGIVILSSVPHQELRFLLPIVPLLCSCFDVAALESASGGRAWISGFVMNFWLVFNAFLALLMGVLHQGGVVPALDHIHGTGELKSRDTAFVWWRTHSPPTWMLLEDTSLLQIMSVNENDGEALKGFHKSRLSLDAMGIAANKLNTLVGKVSREYDNVYLVTPVASFHQHLNPELYEEMWTYSYHVDLDHMDFSALLSLQPGLAIYRLL